MAKADVAFRRAAQLVYAESALARRRGWAAYALNAGESPAAVAWLFAITALAASFGFWAARRAALASRGVSHDRALPFSRSPQRVSFDRFHLTHTVSDGDTLWGIAQHYYGTGSDSNQQRLREANPDLPDDPRQLKVGLRLKIPIA